MGHYQIRKEEIPNLGITQILNFLADLGFDELKPGILGRKEEDKVDLNAISSACIPKFTIQ